MTEELLSQAYRIDYTNFLHRNMFVASTRLVKPDTSGEFELTLLEPAAEGELAFVWIRLLFGYVVGTDRKTRIEEGRPEFLDLPNVYRLVYPEP